MKRGELKQLIREVIEEIAENHPFGLDIDDGQREKLQRAVGDLGAYNVYVNGEEMGDGEIVQTGEIDGKKVVEVYTESGTFYLIDNNPFITTLEGRSVTVDTQTKNKLLKAFKVAGVNIDPKKIQVKDR
jgi:hypothetical protein